MSCCEGSSSRVQRYPGTGCCGTSCAAGQTGCPASEPRIRSCLCQENVGCLDRDDCGGFRPRGTAATGACPGPCQCAEEEAWNRNVPPKPNCEWLSNFSELRRQWSDHGRQNNCKCCNCKSCRTAAPCRPCLPLDPNRCFTSKISHDCQDYCDKRLSGGACDPSTENFIQRDCNLPPMNSSGGCSGCNRTISRSCSPSQCSIENSSSRPPSSCQPCSQSAQPILKERSCCQCIPGHCMCQPMPRTCHCPPPVQVDARAERDCSCECPSSPECACPPSERRFARTKIKCPNARLCPPTPRLQPGPKCNCSKCQPCLPPPCDSCTSSKCRPSVSKIKPCRPDPPCAPDEATPYRPNSPRLPRSLSCQPPPLCAECRRTSNSNSRPQSRKIRQFHRPRSPDEGYGDDDGGGAMESEQCHCGPPASRECDDDCDYCCSIDCVDIPVDDRMRPVDADRAQCDGGNDIINTSRSNNCDYSCSVGCNDEGQAIFQGHDRDQCGCGADGKTCAESCDYCCSQNCDTEGEFRGSDRVALSPIPERIAAGGAEHYTADTFQIHGTGSDFDKSLPVTERAESAVLNRVNLMSKTGLRDSTPAELTNSKACCVTNVGQGEQSPTTAPSVTASSRSACKLLCSLMRAKLPMKYL